MLKYAKFAKLLLMATFLTHALLGQPLYAQAPSTESGTHDLRSSTSIEPIAEEPIHLSIPAGDASSSFVADNLQQGAARGGGVSETSLGDVVIVKTLDKS